MQRCVSPTLFKLFMHDILVPAHPDTDVLSYADHITIFTQHPDPQTATAHLQDYIIILEHLIHLNRMKLFPSKSTLTFITPRANEYNLQLTWILNYTTIIYTGKVILLGATYDKSKSFTQHTDNINTKVKNQPQYPPYCHQHKIRSIQRKQYPGVQIVRRAYTHISLLSMATGYRSNIHTGTTNHQKQRAWNRNWLHKNNSSLPPP